MLQSVQKPVKRLQPRSYHAFRCIGAECDDTCCVGWIVNIDKQTFDAYQGCDDPEFGPRLRELVTINTTNSTEDNYARIALSTPACPFLAEGWCAIHKRLGQEYISVMCSTYPRVMNIVDDVLERSLDLSCPEAARLTLLNPAPIEFDTEEGALHDPRLGSLAVLHTWQQTSDKPYLYFREIREFVIWLLQFRAYPLWKRMAILASFCDQLQEMATDARHSQVPEALRVYRNAVERNMFDSALQPHVAQPARQLELIVELVIGRITSDYTPPRFRDFYRDFMQGIEWTAESGMDDIGRRYAAAHAQYFAPFMNGHEYMLEHYLVSYVHRTLFPLGAQESSRGLSVGQAVQSIREQCMLILIHYGIIQMILIGLAGLHKSEFSTELVVRAIQTFAKTFEHSVPFPKKVFEKLAEKNITTSVALAVLLRN